ncbi:GrpB family protein [Ideonella sp.]|jgi:GrpB-like predicted nucleotidyltransferase (UPF0157 family)|uniref:GrpB family protein n=1 Tax=Ideonella sp. TaxID=1929293 RepID=UPI0037C029F8
MIDIVPYQPAWRDAFVEEAKRLRGQFGNRALRIDHVGSTSVPGLAAKPVIDVQVSFASLEPRAALLAEMAALGYLHVNLGAFDMVYPYFTRPAIWPSTHHVHLCVAGSLVERNHLAFRDYLRLHPDVAADYAQLKSALAAAHDGETLDDQERYSLAKSEFVTKTLAEALRFGLPTPSQSDG